MPDLQFFGVSIYHPDFQFTEGAVGRFVLRFISEQVLLAEVLLQLRERAVQVAVVFRDYGSPAGRLRELFEHAFVDAVPAMITDADRVDHDLGAQRLIDRFVQLHTAGGVLAVGEKDDRLSPRLFGQHIGGGGDYRVPNRSAALSRPAVDGRTA